MHMMCVCVCVFALQHSESHKVHKESHGQSGEDIPRQIPVCRKNKTCTKATLLNFVVHDLIHIKHLIQY